MTGLLCQAVVTTKLRKDPQVKNLTGYKKKKALPTQPHDRLAVEHMLALVMAASGVPASSRTVLVGLKGSNFSVGLEGLGKHLDAKDPTDIIFRNTVYWCWMKHPCGHIVVIVFAVKQPARQVPEPFRFTTISSIRDNLTGILSPGAGPSNAPPPPPCPAPAAGPVPNSAPTLTELANTLACLQARMDSAELGISVTDDRVTEVQNDMAQMERDMTAEANTAFNDKTQLMLRDLGRQIKNTFLHRV